MDLSLPGKYKQYCRPRLAEILGSIRLDKVYHRADGDYLFYYNEGGREVRVIDFLGGYGASLFGHNHPDLVEAAKAAYDSKMPFNSQASCRKYAALLSERLNNILYERTGRNYITVLANTGTECVEAAIKHAELSHRQRIESIHENINRNIIKIKNRLKEGELSFSPCFKKEMENVIKISPDAGYCDIFDAIIEYNISELSATPCFLSLQRSFHGKTSGSVKLTFNELFRSPFQRIGLNVVHIEPHDNESVKRAIEKSRVSYYDLTVDGDNEIIPVRKEHVNITAMFVEPLQGEGGIHIISKEFLTFCRETASFYSFPLVFDEIQSGMGRTGTFLFSEQQGVTADYYLLSKSLGGGLSKVSALMIQDEVYNIDFDMIHSSTFAEDDHSSRIACTALDLLLNGNHMMLYCAVQGEFIKNELQRIQARYPDVIKDVRGAGLMLGIELQNFDDCGSPAIRLLSDQKHLGYIISGYLLHEHSIRVAPTLSDHTTIRLEPSTFISVEDCERLFFAIERLCEILDKQNIYELTRYIIGLETPGVYGEIKDYKQKPFKYNNYVDINRVAFIGHFINSFDIVTWDRGFEQFTIEQLDEYFNKTYKLINCQVTQQHIVNSITGERVELSFIGVYLNPKIIARHVMENDIGPLREKIDEAVKMAAELGCSVVGFGGYTSIITGNCKKVITDSLYLTSGNSLTAAMGIEAIKKTARDLSIELHESVLAVIGASGNISSIYSEIMSEEVSEIILIGRRKNDGRLERLASQIYLNAFNIIKNLKFPGYEKAQCENAAAGLHGIAGKIMQTKAVRDILKEDIETEDTGEWLFENVTLEMGSGAPVKITTDPANIKDANLIVSASNSVEPVIYSQMLGKGPIVICDIAVPPDTDDSVMHERDDVTVIQGGVVNLPANPDFSIRGIPLDPGYAFACMSETLLMGLEGIKDHYSYGKINRDQVERILDISAKHGFTLAKSKTERSY